LRLDSGDLVDLRLGKIFRHGESLRSEPLIDIFNLGNGNAVTGMVTAFGPAYLRPSRILNPRLMRFGLKINF